MNNFERFVIENHKKERTGFEESFSSFKLDRDARGEYTNRYVQYAWEGWLMCAFRNKKDTIGYCQPVSDVGLHKESWMQGMITAAKIAETAYTAYDAAIAIHEAVEAKRNPCSKTPEKPNI